MQFESKLRMARNSIVVDPRPAAPAALHRRPARIPDPGAQIHARPVHGICLGERRRQNPFCARGGASARNPVRHDRRVLALVADNASDR
jgi:hypothetical protein